MRKALILSLSAITWAFGSISSFATFIDPIVNCESEDRNLVLAIDKVQGPMPSKPYLYGNISEMRNGKKEVRGEYRVTRIPASVRGGQLISAQYHGVDSNRRGDSFILIEPGEVRPQPTLILNGGEPLTLNCKRI